MNTVTEQYNQPGKWEIEIPLGKVREEIEWVGIVDAREPGEYKLQVIADHRAMGTKGRITVKAVVGAHARVTIKGVIKIAKEAQETDSFLEIRVLLLDSTAYATADPELEIEANNVKASHAASIGQIDPEQIMYLMSRGMSNKQAQNEIVYGFLMIQ
jgi:Fe-S cluster assembly protein SufD